MRLDLETRLAVNRVFQQQECVDRAVRATVDFLYSRELFDPERGEENRVIFYRLVTDLHAQEEAMLETYRKVPGGGGRPLITSAAWCLLR